MANIIGVFLLAIGGIIGLVVLAAVAGVALAVLGLAIKAAVPAVLIYLGYRLVTRDQNAVAD